MGGATLDGRHYQVDGAISRPLPAQDGGIPLWIAGGGEKKTLRIAAQYANYTNFAGGADDFAHKSEVLAAHCKDVGTDFDAIVRSANYNVVIGETEKDVQDRLAWVRSHYEPHVPAEALESTYRNVATGPLVGTPEQIAERLTELRGLGMTYAITYFPEAAYDRSGIDLFVRDVVPALADQDDAEGAPRRNRAEGPLPCHCGSLTTVTKKSSIWRMTSMKRSKSTGLLT